MQTHPHTHGFSNAYWYIQLNAYRGVRAKAGQTAIHITSVATEALRRSLSTLIPEGLYDLLEYISTTVKESVSAGMFVKARENPCMYSMHSTKKGAFSCSLFLSCCGGSSCDALPAVSAGKTMGAPPRRSTVRHVAHQSSSTPSLISFANRVANIRVGKLFVARLASVVFDGLRSRHCSALQ